MMYIGFSVQSHKIGAKIICKHFKHCAPIVAKQKQYELYQFVNHDNISIIQIKKRDLKLLEQYGWQFIKYNKLYIPDIHINTKAITCVQFTKHFCGIKNIFIQTPDKLFKYLRK